MPESVRLAAPALVSPPLPLTAAPTDRSALVVTVWVAVGRPTVPAAALRFSELASTATVASAAIVTAPDHELVPDRFSTTPVPPTPVPLMVNASAPTAMPPCTWRVAPGDTVVPAAVVPRAVLLAT